MGKLQELAKVRFTNAFIDIVDNCKLKKVESTKELKKGEYEAGHIVECEGIDISIAFQELIAANKVFNIAKESGI